VCYLLGSTFKPSTSEPLEFVFSARQPRGALVHRLLRLSGAINHTSGNVSGGLKDALYDDSDVT